MTGAQHRRGNRTSTIIALVLCVSIAACTTGAPSGDYVKDGVQYGVTEGQFRGRWWNHYERGRSYALGQFWAEAESDFRAALAGRAADQLWPRTYGLHFVPEYFPNRELGIALFHQDRLDEAIESLERSVSQRFSARAGYYLTLARRQSVQNTGSDTQPPTIEIASQTSAQPVSAYEAVIAGVARDDSYVAAIYVDEQPVPVQLAASEVPFHYPCTLQPGDNTVVVRVEDITGKTTSTEVQLLADVDGPSVVFDSPVRIPGVVRGEIFDQ